MYIYFFKELAHAVIGARKPEICRVGQQVGNSGMSYCCSLEEEFLFLQETSVFARKALN